MKNDSKFEPLLICPYCLNEVKNEQNYCRQCKEYYEGSRGRLLELSGSGCNTDSVQRSGSDLLNSLSSDGRDIRPF